MKIFKRLLVLALVVAMVVSTAACGSKGGANGENGNYDLVVKYYSGAYGDDWIKLAAEEFGKEKGVKVSKIILHPKSKDEMGITFENIEKSIKRSQSKNHDEK